MNRFLCEKCIFFEKMLAIKNKRGIIALSEQKDIKSSRIKKKFVLIFKEKNYVRIKNKLRINFNQFQKC